MKNSIILNKKEIGLALGGGAMKGVAILPIIKGLKSEGVKISCVSGASVGAIIGAYYALYGEVETLREEILGMSKSRWFSMMDFCKFPKRSLIKAKKFREFLESKFGDKTFEDLKIPLIVSVTNLTKGRVEYISSGNLVDAIIASSAYPGVFPPVRKGKDVYVDGAVLNNLPYEVLFKRKISKVIAISLSMKNTKRKSKNIFHLIFSSFGLLLDNAFKGVPEETNRLFVFGPRFDKSMGSMWNVSKIKLKHEAGIKSFNENREKLLNWIE